MEDRFADVWKRRNEIHPVVMENRVDTDWAKGRNQTLAFLVRIRDRKLIEKIVKIQEALSTIPCVAPIPKDYLHMTVKMCGFLSESVEYGDDISVNDLQRIIKQAKAILQTFSRFQVFLSKLNIVSDVVFIEVHDEDRIGKLNKGLQAIPEIVKMEFDYPNFLPHISIAEFQNRQEFNRLISYLEKARDVEFGIATINSIELIVAHLGKGYPEIETMQTFELKR